MDARFRKKYLSLLTRINISSKAVKWYLYWVMAFERALPDVPLNKRSKEDVQAYLDVLVKRKKYKDWQMDQANDALCVLFGDYFAFSWAKPWPVIVSSIGEDVLFHKIESKIEKKIIFKDIPNWSGLEMRLPGLTDRAKKVLRTTHYAYRTEKTYLEWICRYLSFNGFKEPDKLSAADVRVYLEYLATEREIAGNTQKQALNAIAFLYNKVLEKPLGEIGSYARPKLPKRLPVVFTREEKDRVLREVTGIYALMAGLLYGSGLRLLECARLRVKDVDFGYQQIMVRNGKGAKDRVTILPKKYEEELKEHLKSIKIQHEKDLAQGHGEVYLWPSLERKYRNIAKEWGWQYVFPAYNLSVDPRSGEVRRHHICENSLQRAVKKAIRRAGITKQASCHTLRHSFAPLEM